MNAILNKSQTVVEYVTVRKAAELTGYSERAIRHKISNGLWPENIVWKWAPDGVQLIIMEGYYTWANQIGKVSMRGRHPSASTSFTLGTNTSSL